jgi:pimeloyl-ACP methyl ester carboxylesterase
MNFFESSVGRLAYVDLGEGPTCIIFLHNGGDCSDLWLHQIQHFSKTHRVLAPDLIGFGQSDRSARALTIDLQLKALTEWATHLNLSDYSIVGNCIGAALAVELSKSMTCKAKRLVLVNLCIGAQGLAPGLALTTRVLKASGSLGASLVKLISKSEFLSKRIQRGTWIGGQFEFNPVFQALSKNAAHPLQFQSRMGLVLGLPSFDEWWQRLVSSELSVPTHLFWGSKNTVIPLTTGLKVKDRLQALSFVEFKNSGHLPMAEEPELFNQELAKIL